MFCTDIKKLILTYYGEVENNLKYFHTYCDSLPKGNINIQLSNVNLMETRINLLLLLFHDRPVLDEVATSYDSFFQRTTLNFHNLVALRY